MAAQRYLFLVLLCGQNSLYTLLRRYSRGVLKEKISSSVVLLASEVLKFAIAAAFVDTQASEPQSAPRKHWAASRLAHVKNVLLQGRPMAVPAITYLIMNLLSFKAIELVDATVFAMLAQLKILTTALFSWPVLGRRVTLPQWRAIVLLTMAVAIITYQRGHSAEACGDAAAAVESSRQSSPARTSLSYLIGVGMVLLEISLSGWIGTYFEKYLKDGSASVWERNLQLSGWSMTVYSLIEVAKTSSAFLLEPEAQDFQAQVEGQAQANILSWSPVSVCLVILGGAGGLLVALAIKHADAIMKSMAAAFSLVIVVGVEMSLLGAPADMVVCLAAAIGIISLQVYQDAPKAAPPEASPKSRGVSKQDSGKNEAFSDMELDVQEAQDEELRELRPRDGA